MSLLRLAIKQRTHLLSPHPYTLQSATCTFMESSVGSGLTARHSTSRSASPPSKRVRVDGPSAGESSSGAATTSATTVLKPAPAELQARKVEKAAAQAQKKHLKKLRKAHADSVQKFGEPPIYFDILEMLGNSVVEKRVNEDTDFTMPVERGAELELDIVRLSAHGDGLAVGPSGDWVVATPFCLPGERVLARITGGERLYARAALVKVLSRSDDLRRDDLVGCKYFGRCGGCQYQMTTYEKQLELKQTVVKRAFLHYSGLSKILMPSVLPTIPSPEQYRYRTKLTPHFELPRAVKNHRKGPNKNAPMNLDSLDLQIGFDAVSGDKGVLDIEECPIATQVINDNLPEKRAEVRRNITSYKNGATLLLRDSLEAFEFEDVEHGPRSIVITDHKATVKELVGTTKFESPAGAFFQNNRSILPSLLEYVRSSIASEINDSERYLVDAYCGSGLFALCLASIFKEVSGVEISGPSIASAKRNAELNGINNAKFLAGNAEDIFGTISYPSKQTTVIIDPPRRGCDEAFIKQLLKLGPQHIIYVSCNVHTQARDVGMIVRVEPAYEIVSIRGADLFPQTHHVEGVCILRRADKIVGVNVAESA